MGNISESAQDAVLQTIGGSTVRPVLMTPQMARALLERRAPNRRIEPGTVRTYAYSLREGKWSSTSMIVIDAQGRLRDGQHRLSAIVATDIAAWMLVGEFRSEAEMQYIDMHRPRTAADSLRIETGDVHSRSKIAVASVAAKMAIRGCVRVPPDLARVFLGRLGDDIVLCERAPRIAAPVLFPLIYARGLAPRLIDDVHGRLLSGDMVVVAGEYHAQRTTTLGALLRLTQRPKSHPLRTVRGVLRGLRALIEGEALKAVREDADGLPWVDEQRKSRGLPTLAEMVPPTYSEVPSSRGKKRQQLNS